MTLYYTARNLIRTVSDRVSTGADATITNQEKNLTSNSLVIQLGYHRLFDHGFRAGLSARLPSLEIYGEGTFNQTRVTTNPFSDQTINRGQIKTETRIPAKIALGVAHERPERATYALDVSYYFPAQYRDMDLPEAADDVNHKEVVNVALGTEQVLKPWLRFRLGAFTNFSSHRDPDLRSSQRQGDRIDMWGWSSNLAYYSRENVSFTFGGYYTGGRGNSVQRSGNAYVVIPKSHQIFTMLVGSSYHF